MNVLIVTGIWPPDVGGPATHAPEVAEHLSVRGHRVAVVTSAAAPPEPQPFPVHWISRRIPRGVRHLAAVRAIAVYARAADVVYSTGMLGRSSLGAALAGRPLVFKLTSDPTYERSVRYSLTTRDLDSYQEQHGARIAVLRRARDLAIGRAAHVVCPSESIRRLALGWGLAPDSVTTLPNPVAAPVDLPGRDELRRRHGLEGPTLAYAGRLSVQKAVDVALEAIARTPSISFVIAGDGPDSDLLRRRAHDLSLDGRARFLGPVSRREVFELLHAADAAVLSSKWENFPHMAVEALAVGTPVIATATGGVTEIVEDGRNGLLVPPGDPGALAATIERYFGDGELQARLRAGTVASVERFSPEQIYDRLEEVLRFAADAERQ